MYIERALQGREGSPDISLIILDASECEHFDILLFKRPVSMVFFLIEDISLSMCEGLTVTPK
jgi:hypothetical protein